MLEVVGQDIISGNMGFIGTDPGREYQMGTAEKTEDITVTGNPAVLDNATGKPFKDLHIYGRSEQMTTTGAQLFDAASIKKNDKIQVEISDNSYTIQMTTTINESGSPSNRVYIAINHVIEGDFSGKTVTLSYDGVNSDVPNERYVIGLMYNTDDGRTHYLSLQKDMPKSISVTLPENTTNLTLRLFITEFTSPTVPAGTYTVTIQGAMLTEGSEKKDWEPYTGGKPSPSPDYPQEIVSAGEGGSVTVKVTGRNILDMRNSKESAANSGVTYTRNADYSFTRTGTATEGSGNVWMAGGYLVKPKADLSNVFCVLLKGVKYSIKDCVLLTVSPAGNVLAARNENFVPTQDMYITGVRNENFIVGETYNDIVYPAVYVGEKALQYEPYREQLLTIPTPNGLPGVPVTSGGNYTDPQGQQWICDEVDFGRGVYVQRVKVKELSADDKWTYRKLDSGNNNFQTRIYGGDSAKSSFPAICNILPYKNLIWNDDSKNLPKIYANNNEITISFPPSSEYSSLETFKQLLTNAKSFIFYCLATPIETPLTAAEIAAYKSLRTYRGTTIVEAEDKAGISVTYKRNAKTDNVSAEKKIEESEKKEYDES